MGTCYTPWMVRAPWLLLLALPAFGQLTMDQKVFDFQALAGVYAKHYPDISLDYMTRDNLVNAGRPFVQAFTDALVRQIQKGQ